MMEQLHITENFFNEEFKEADFPGIFPQMHRKPNTPRRRVTVDSLDKNKTKPARRRSKSQSSQEGESKAAQRRKSQNSDTEMVTVKEEPDSPARKQPVTEKNNVKGQQPDENKSPVSVRRGSTAEKTIDKQKPKASKNITKALLENDNNNDDDNGVRSKESELHSPTKTKRRKVLSIDSDDEVEEYAVEPTTTTREEDMIQVSEKPGNEVEVNGEDSNTKEETSDHSDDIFIPPVAAAGMKTQVLKLDKVKPPSEIFIKELKKFIRNSIRSGCVSFAELKEILSMQQKGKVEDNFVRLALRISVTHTVNLIL